MSKHLANNMFWLETPITKFYEALGCVSDGRVKKLSEDSFLVTASTWNKRYKVTYHHNEQAITSNDNSSYYVGYLGYPGIATLLFLDVITYDSRFGELLRGVNWKALNQSNNNNFDKTVSDLLSQMTASEALELQDYIKGLKVNFDNLQLKKLGKTQVPAKYD